MSNDWDTDLEGNPFRSPSSDCNAFVSGEETGHVITPKVLAMLRQTQPWVRFLSVLGFICSVLMAMAGIIGLAVPMFATGNMGPVECFIMMLVYFPIAAVYFVPSLFLFRYASRINALWATHSMRELEDALEAQKSFWKFAGILVLVVIFMYLGFVVFIGLAAIHPP